MAKNFGIDNGRNCLIGVFFNILEEIISERLEELTNNKPFDNFVDIKNIKNNDENKFSIENKYYDAALQRVGDVIKNIVNESRVSLIKWR